MTSIRRLLPFGVILVTVSWWLGCANERPGAAEYGAPSSETSCAQSGAGCGCEVEGEEVACGTVERRSGDYVSCSEGKRRCSGGHWSDCVGDQVITKTIPVGGVATQGLGAKQSCAWNPCDPYCSGFADDAVGLTVPPDAGLAASDAGLSIIVGTNANIPCASLTMTPATSTVTVTSLSPFTTSPSSVSFTPSLNPSACYAGALNASWSTSAPDRVAVTAGTATVVDAVAGNVQVSAYVGTFVATSTIAVAVQAKDDSLAPAGAVAAFAGAPGVADNATILYPYYDTYFPQGLAAPLMQWSSPSAATAVKVTLKFPATGTPIFQFSAIVPESALPSYAMPQAVWAAIERTATGADVAIELQRIVGGVLRQPVLHRVHFTPSRLRGKIFYTEYNVGAWTGTLRVIDPSQNIAAKNAFANAPGSCPVCHSVSSDGRTLVTSDWGGQPSVVNSVGSDGLLTRLSSAPDYPSGGDTRAFAYSAISPDGAIVLQGSNWWGNTSPALPYKIFSLDPTTGAPTDVSATSTNNWGLGAATMMVPSFSPDGKRLVFVDGDTGGGAAWRQGISTFDFSSASKAFSNRKNIVKTASASRITRWPTFEPDSRSVVYQTNPTGDDSSSYGGMTPSGYNKNEGRMWSVDTNASPGTPVSLDKLNQGTDATDINRSYQATFLPVAIGGYRWSVFTSGRQYGNSLNLPASNRTTQLWLSAVDDTPSAATDRSHRPFLLPNQVLGDNASARTLNERGYWVLDACKPVLPTTPAPPPAWLWQTKDVGAVGQPGTTSGSDPSFTVAGAGADIWGSVDGFRFVYKDAIGDGTITADIVSQTNTNSWAKAGVMIRQSLADDSPYIMVGTTPGNGSIVQLRATSGAATTQPSVTSGIAPRWVRVKKTGTSYQAYLSSNGTTWSTFGGAVTLATTGTIYIGVAVTSHTTGALSTVAFTNIAQDFTRAPPPDPAAASTCNSSEDCCGGTSSPATAECRIDLPVASPVKRYCRATSATACVMDGNACSADVDCCGFPASHCDTSTGLCAAPPPVKVAPSASYTRDFSAICRPDKQLKWHFFDWISTTPSDTSIRFEATSSATVAGLSATPVLLANVQGVQPASWTGVDVDPKLVAGGQRSQQYLRITMTLFASSDRLASPLLSTWRQAYSCVDSE